MVIIISSIIVITAKKQNLTHLNPGVRQKESRQKVKSDDMKHCYGDDANEQQG